MKFLTNQARLNSLADLLSMIQDDDEAIERCNDLISEILDHGSVDELVNGFQGVNWDDLDGNFVVDMDALIQSASAHGNLFIELAKKEMYGLLCAEARASIGRTSSQNEERLSSEEIKGLSMNCPKTSLALEYSALGLGVYERKIVVDMRDAYSVDFAASLTGQGRELRGLVDVRVDHLSDERHSVLVYFPADEFCFDMIKNRLLEFVATREGADARVMPVEHVSPLIPGCKDLIDYKKVSN